MSQLFKQFDKNTIESLPISEVNQVTPAQLSQEILIIMKNGDLYYCEAFTISGNNLIGEFEPEERRGEKGMERLI